MGARRLLIESPQLNEFVFLETPTLDGPDAHLGKAKPKALVILATFNGAQWLGEQVNSILRQDGVEVKLIIGDDASYDSTASILKELSHDPRIELLPNHSPSGSAAKNFFRLFESCDGNAYDLIAFADQDDIWESHKLIRAHTQLQEYPDAAGYSSATIATWPDGRRRLQKQCKRMTRNDFLFEGAGQGCTFAVRPKFYEELRQFLQSNSTIFRAIHYHDWATYAVARATYYKWIFDSEPTVLYRQHPKNDTGARRSITGTGRRIKLIASGWYQHQLLAIAAVAQAANPSSQTIQNWAVLARSPRCITRQIRVIKFLASGGRRKLSDTIVLCLAALCGLI